MILDHAMIQLGHVVIGATVKATLVLAVATVLAVALRRRASAATRHLIWTLAASTMLLLPLLSWVLPRWELGMIDSASAVTFSPQSVKPESAKYASPPQRASAALRLSWMTMAVPAWIAGALVVTFPSLLGVGVLTWIHRRQRDADDRKMLDELCHALAIRRHVRLLITNSSEMPITWGLLRPCVLLPASAKDWPAERLKCVLLHELAHIKRLDCATQVVGQLACAVYWFNPLGWWMLRRMRAEREQACDDVVLRRGEPGAAAYAEHLLALARSLRPAPPISALAAVAIARTSQLRVRIESMLDPSISHRPLTRRAAVTAVVVASLVVAPLAMLKAYAATPATGVGTPNGTPSVPAHDAATSNPIVLQVLKARIAVLEAELTQFRTAHPQLEPTPIQQQQLATVSQAYTLAQLEMIEARAAYLSGHPVFQRAQQREQDLYARYQEIFKDVMAMNIVAADYQKLTYELERLKRRVAQLQQARESQNSATTHAVSTSPTSP